MMSIDQIKQTQEIFAGKSNAEVTIFPGAAHGCKQFFLFERTYSLPVPSNDSF